MLRQLSIASLQQPNPKGFISAASGLVCAYGKAYVIADDEHHLAVFSDASQHGELFRLLDGDLPQGHKERKSLKPDFESLFLLPKLDQRREHGLVALGSGSRPNRCQGVYVPLNTSGEPSGPILPFDLSPIYSKLDKIFGDINIEGAMLCAGHWVLLHRGKANTCEAEGNASGNASLHYPLSVLYALLQGENIDYAPSKIQRFDLGKIHQVSLGFTDCAALPDGSWLYTAVAEDTTDSYQDGDFLGAVIGKVSPRGQVVWQRPLTPSCKVEGLAVRVLDNGSQDGLEICLVTDADKPNQPALMLKAQLKH